MAEKRFVIPANIEKMCIKMRCCRDCSIGREANRENMTCPQYIEEKPDKADQLTREWEEKTK